MNSKEKEDLLKEKMMYTKKSGKYSVLEQDKEIDVKKVYDRQIIVKLYDSKKFNAKKYNCGILDIPGFMENRNYMLLKVPEGQDYEETLNEIKNDPAVEYASPNYIYEIQSIPNDPYYSAQWYLDKIKMPEVWDSFKEENETVVAVIDTGVDYTHPDLKDRVLPGIDFVNDDDDPMDDVGHGTHVAGIIAAVSNNGQGIAGITSKVKILPVKCADKDGISSLNIVKGIYYTIDHQVDVINMSFVSYADDPIEEDAIMEAYARGIVVVASAGNDGTDEWAYPASYWPVISVGASDEGDNKADFSNWGSFLDILAPGVNILSTVWSGADDDGQRDGYIFYDGTSMAAPIVSAVAALIKSEHPSWGPDEIEWALELGADRKDESVLWDRYNGYGRINALESLKESLPDLVYDAGDSKESARKLSPSEVAQEKIDKPGDNDFFLLM